MRGVFAIPPTPFRADGALDEEGLRAVIGFMLEAGAHGVVTPVNASEFAFLTDSERQRVVEITIGEVAGAVPVVAGLTGTCSEHALVFARHARAVGADAVIAMPPYVSKASAEQIVDYYTAVAGEAHLPVFVQNHMPPLGSAMAPNLVARLVRDIDGVDYIKEECWPPGQYMSEEIELAGPALKGVMGGIGGRYQLDEYARGARGTMPAGEMTDVHVQLWDRLEDGDTAGAEQIHRDMLPLLTLETLYGVAVYKEVLARRGLISSTYLRRPGRRTLDAHDHFALDRALERLEPYFQLKPPDRHDPRSASPGDGEQREVKVL